MEMARVVSVARVLEPLEQAAASNAQLLRSCYRRLAERQRNLFALFGESLGNALRGVLDLLADEIADRGQVLR